MKPQINGAQSQAYGESIPKSLYRQLT